MISGKQTLGQILSVLLLLHLLFLILLAPLSASYASGAQVLSHCYSETKDIIQRIFNFMCPNPKIYQRASRGSFVQLLGLVFDLYPNILCRTVRLREHWPWKLCVKGGRAWRWELAWFLESPLRAPLLSRSICFGLYVSENKLLLCLSHCTFWDGFL